MKQQYKSFQEFYPYYLSEHQNKSCRILHFIGTSLVLILLVSALISKSWVLFFLTPIAGYSFAWIGHFFFEKNRPATFTYPRWSLMGDFLMFWHLLTGRLSFSGGDSREKST